MVFGSKVVAAAGTAVQLVSVPTRASALWTEGKKVVGSNTGSVYIGDDTVDKTTAQFRELATGEYWEVPLGGAVIDLMDIWVDAATTADGVVFGYIAV